MSVKRGNQVISPLTGEKDKKQKSFDFESDNNSSKMNSKAIHDEVRETVITRVNEQFKSLSIPSDKSGSNEVLNGLLQTVMPVIITSVVTAVTEVMTKFMSRMDQ